MTNLYVWASRCHLDVQVHTPITKMITRDAKWSLRTFKQVVLVCQPKPFQQGGSQQLPVDGGPMAGGEHIYIYIYTPFANIRGHIFGVGTIRIDILAKSRFGRSIFGGDRFLE